MVSPPGVHEPPTPGYSAPMRLTAIPLVGLFILLGCEPTTVTPRHHDAVDDVDPGVKKRLAQIQH
jgi:hypothetical protein